MWKKNRKLILVEINEPNHSSLVSSWINCLKGSNCQFEIAVSRSTAVELDKNEQKIATTFSNSVTFLFWVLSQVFRQNLIVVLTYQANWVLIFLLAITNKTIITVHNVNNWFCENPKNLNLKNYIKYKLRRIILSRTNYISVNSQNMKNSVEKYSVSRGKEIFVVPFDISRRESVENNLSQQDIFHIPG